MNRLQTRLYLLLSIILSISACGGNAETSSSEPNKDSSGIGSYLLDTISGTLTLPESVSRSPTEVRVFVEGDETLYDETEDEGSFTIANVPSGKRAYMLLKKLLIIKLMGFVCARLWSWRQKILQSVNLK